MSSSALPDLSGLVALAQERDLDLRPILLRVQTDLFISAPSRDRETIAAFEALALGFLAVVDDDTAAIVARKLAPLADTPPRVIEALMARGGAARQAVIEGLPHLPQDTVAAVLAHEPSLAPALAARIDLPAVTLADLTRQENPAVDLVLAQNRRVTLGRALETLVERARRRPALAEALLARADLSLADEAILYVHADAPRRVLIRERLETYAPAAAALRPAAQLRLDPNARDDLLARAADGDAPGFRGALARALGIGAPPDAVWRLDQEAHQELVAFALAAAGLPREDAIQIFLTLDPETSRSVHAVFRLANLVRTTPRAVALYLTEAALDRKIGRHPGRHIPLMDPSSAPDRTTPFARQPATRTVPQRREAEAR